MDHKSAYFQKEIQGLRALAIISVLLYHYFDNFLYSGFLGVDVFFVISGYVITSYLHRTSNKNNKIYYLLNFYSRRIKRLLPALFFCVLITSLLFIFLTTNPTREIFVAGASAIFGVSNIYFFLKSTNYFALDFELNPFMHTWSLGLEEQFYLVFPLFFIFFSYKKIIKLNLNSNFFYILSFITFVSLASYITINFFYENTTFYLMPTRFWELSMGSISFYLVNKNFFIKRNIISFFIFCFLILTFFLPQALSKYSTILCVFLTSFLMLNLNKNHFVYKLLTLKTFIFIGSISYSLYLWHWSLLSLAKWTFGNSLLIKFILIVLSFFMASISYYYIERPLRYAKLDFKPIKIILIGICLSITISFFLVFKLPDFINNNNNTLTYFFNTKKFYKMEPIFDKKICLDQSTIIKMDNPLQNCLNRERTKEKSSRVYLVGDSHANQFITPINESIKKTKYKLNFIEIIKYSSNKKLDFPRSYLGGINNSQTIDFIINNSNKDDIVIISFHRGRLNNFRDRHIPLSQPVKINDKSNFFLENANRDIKRLKNKGVKVLLISDTQLMSVVSTNEVCYMQYKFFGESSCRIYKIQDRHTRFRQDFIFEKIKLFNPNVYLWDPLDHIYGDKDYLEIVDKNDKYLMKDWNHISEFQSRLLNKPIKSVINKIIKLNN